CVITGTHTVFPSKSNASFLDKKSKSYDSGNPNSLKPSLIVKFLIPSGSRLGTPSLLTSIATKVGVISYGDKILLYSNDNLPVTILYPFGDRKSTRLNSSHVSISYAVFCLKKKK